MPQYARLPVAEHPAYPRPCDACQGHGVTGEQYQMPTDSGPTLIVDVICPQCTGCGNGDPDHGECPADAHAYPDDDAEAADDDQGDDGAERCYSCGSGRGWNAVQGFTGDDDDAALVVLRMPCGCAADRLETAAAP